VMPRWGAMSQILCRHVLLLHKFAEHPLISGWPEPLSSDWCHLLSFRGLTTVTQHWLASHHTFYRGSSHWWAPLLGSSFCLPWSTTSLHSSASYTDWRLSSVPSSRVYTIVVHRRTLSSGRRRGSSGTQTLFHVVFINSGNENDVKHC